MAELARRPVGRTGVEVTLVGFGALEIGRDWGLGDAAQRQRPAEAGKVRGLVQAGWTGREALKGFTRR